MYVDDLAFLADIPKEEDFGRWNLFVNLKKSIIIVFQKGKA